MSTSKQMKEEIISSLEEYYNINVESLAWCNVIDQVDGEGYVMWSDMGTYKLVDRELFSHANFNQSQFGRV